MGGHVCRWSPQRGIQNCIITVAEVGKRMGFLMKRAKVIRKGQLISPELSRGLLVCVSLLGRLLEKL